MPGLTASPTAAPTTTPTPSPTSIAGTVVDLSDPELGIVFEDVPDLSGDEADVYNWLATFQVEYWRTLTTNMVSPAFDIIASPEEKARMEGLAERNAAEGLVIAGTFHVTVDDVSLTGESARAVVCHDYRDVTLVGPEGPRTLADEGIDVPRLFEFTLAPSPLTASTWTVVVGEVIGTC